MAESIGTLNAKVTADASQFVSEFNRAENSARRASTNMEREIGDLARKLKKKFELADVGKDILKGAGLFGGFSIAEKAADMIVSHFKEAAEAAKMMEESTARSLAHVQRTIEMRQTPEQQLDTIKKRREELAKELETLNSVERRRFTVWNPNQTQTTLVRDLTKDEKARLYELTDELEKVGEKYDALAKKIKESKKAEREHGDAKESADKLRVWNEQLRIQEKAFDDLVAAKKRDNDATADARKKAEDLAQGYRLLGDATLKYELRLKEIEALRGDGKLSPDEAWAAKVATWTDLAESVEKRSGNKGTVRDLKEISGEQQDAINKVQEGLLKANDAAKELGMTFSSAFEDAIVGGGKLSEVLRGLAQDVLRIFVRQTVTTPLAGALSGIFAGMFGKPAADGGYRDGSQPYLVGEEGPEIFNPGTAGTVIPAGRTAAMIGGGGGNVVNNFNWSFGAGVTAQQVAAMIPSIINQTKAAVAESVQRGGSYRRAFA